MAQIPTPRSYNQILGDMIDAFLSRFGLKSLKIGSPVLAIMEAAAQSDLRSSQDIFDLLNAQSLDRASGLALDRLGADEDLVRLTESPASGAVTITDTSFQKKASKIYRGMPAPIVGSDKIYVVDASSFPASGTVYLGRGTTNYEGPLAYNSKVNNGTYWTLNLTDSTRRFHNVGESVIVGQGGNRVINSGTLVQTPQGNVTDAVQFSTLFQAVIPDGEVEITGVQVIAQKPGIGSNVAAGAINAFVSPPFPGASVTNSLPFTNGTATEDDKSFRERIRAVRQSRAKGTALALTTAVQGIIAQDENKRVSSASVVTRQGHPTTLYIDDGTGYEEVAEGVAVEPLVDAALGGEQYFQASAARPVAKASIISLNQAPFIISSGSKLALKVGGVLHEHTFDSSEFRSINNATAYEVAASINANPNLGFSASTAASGTRVRIFAKNDTQEDLEVVTPSTGNDANAALLFTRGRVDTMRLYKNDRLLSKDGKAAIISSKPPSVWGTLVSGETLTIAVDGTAPVTYTFTDQDFVDARTGFTSVGRNSVAAWAAVLNAKIPGITAKDANGILEIVSNAGYSARAKLAITGGTLVTPGQMFAAQTVSGANRDYTLDRNTGQIRLETPLKAGDSLSVGTTSTRAFVESAPLPTTSIASGGARLWFSVDGDAQAVSTGLNSTTVLGTTVQRLETWGNRVRITANSDVFSNVRTGDWVLGWDANLAAGMKGIFRVAQASNSWVDVERQSMLSGRAHFTATALNNGKVLVVGGLSDNGQYLRSCEIYDPTTNTWTPTGPLAEARAHHTATLLTNGKVVVVGGENRNLSDLDSTTLSSVEMYDPATGTWTTMAPLPSGHSRRQHVAGLLTSSNERVIVAGGIRKSGGSDVVVNTTFLFDAGTNTWTQVANMLTPRWDAQGVVLTGGLKFLVFGGTTNDAGTTITAVSELYDYHLAAWSTTGAMDTARRSHRSTILADGKVLTSGGITAGGATTATAEVYDPSGSGTWSATGAMSAPRHSHVMAIQGNNQVLTAFGQNGSTMLLTGETWNSGTGTWTPTAAPMSKSGRSGGRAVKLNNGNVLVMGGSSLDIASPGQMQASAEIYAASTNIWSPTDANVTQAHYTLANNGLVFVRATSAIQEITIPTGSSFTARNFADIINSQLQGAQAKTYRTNMIRVNTRTYELGGDIAMVSADTEGTKLQIPTSDAVKNLSTHLAAVQSGNTQAGTPEFTLAEVVSGETDTRIVIHNGGKPVSVQNMVVGLRSLDSAHTTPSPIYRHSHNSTVVSPIQEVTTYLNLPTLTLRNPGIEWIAKDRLFLAAPFAIGYQDDLTVVVDQDTGSKRFTTNLYRKLTPVGGTYGTTNIFKDKDNGGASLAAAFGLGYDFNDFAVYMRSRAKTHPDDSTKTILWRYTRPGPDGDTARIRFTYPDAPTKPLAVVTDASKGKFTDISVALPSGPLKTGYALRNGSKIGTAAATGPGGLHILSFIFGYPVANATRDTRLWFKDQTSDWVIGETITGALSGATAIVAEVISDAGTTGVIRITNVSGTFHVDETITGSGGGAAKTDGSQYQQVTLTLTLPNTGAGALANITNHGFQVGNGLFLSSTNANFPSGLKTLTEVTATTVAYTEAHSFNGSATNIGTVSFDAVGEVTLSGASPAPVAVSDLFRVEGTSSLPVEYENKTIRISYYSYQVVQGYVESFSGSVSSTPIWTTVGDAASVKIYSLDSASATAAAIATKVKGFADAEDSTCPVTAKATGSGVIDMATFEDTLTADSWIHLRDGVNYVKSTISPATEADDYQLSFKNPISADLATGADWANEDVRLVPITIKNLVDWFNTLTVTGLSSACAIEATDQGQRLQIASLTPGSAGSVQVQGGSASSASAAVNGSASLVTDGGSTYSLVTAKKSDAVGMTAGMWVSIQNTAPIPKNVIQAATDLESWAANGVMVFSNAVPLWTYANPAPITSRTWQIEKQGRYVCYRFNPFLAAGLQSPPDISGAKEGDWVRITSAATPSANAVPVSSVNQGIYRVIRVDAGSPNVPGRAFWIENPNVLEETSEMDIAFFTFDSVMPGDQLSISTDLWGADNKGLWTIETVGQVGGSGAQFADRYTMKVSVGSRVPVPVSFPGPGPLGAANYRLVQITEGTPGKLIKKIRAISPHQADGKYVDIKFETGEGYAGIGGAIGSVITPLDKLAFGGDVAQGIDGYSHTTGLIAEANRVIYGDPRDPAAYPGVVAAGANLNISGPLVKRITCALNLRIRSGVSSIDVADRVRSAVASVVNKTGIGKPIAISDLVNAASKVNGVIAVSVVSPSYNADSDLIPVQPFEKPMMLNLDQDVLISFAGE